MENGLDLSPVATWTLIAIAFASPFIFMAIVYLSLMSASSDSYYDVAQSPSGEDESPPPASSVRWFINKVGLVQPYNQYTCRDVRLVAVDRPGEGVMFYDEAFFEAETRHEFHGYRVRYLPDQDDLSWID